MAAPGGRTWVCIHLNTTSPNNPAETTQAWRNALLESCRNLGSKAQRLLYAASDYHSKRGHLCLQICPRFTAFRTCFFFFSFSTHSHIILKQRITHISHAEISRMKNEVSIPFSFVYLNGHILLSPKPSPSVFCDLITNGISP